MAIADPKDYAVKKDKEMADEAADLRAQVGELSTQVQALLAKQQMAGGISADQLEAVMARLVQVQADALAKAQREAAEHEQRENLRFPRVSVYSYPEGDKIRPRPQFKCRIFWCGFDLDWDTTTAAEIELLNQVEPGDYTFRRIGGALEKVTVTGERSATGALTKLQIAFPAKEQRDTLPPMLWILRDIVGVKSSEEQEIERLRREIETLRTAQAVA